MLLSDQRIIKAMLSIAAQMIETNLKRYADDYVIKNQFLIDVADMCRIMGKEPVGSSRDSVRDAILRISSTQFFVQAKPNGKFAREVLDGSDEHYFPFFKDLKVSNVKSSSFDEASTSDVRKDRFYLVEFNNNTFEALTNENERKLYAANPKILEAKSGIIQSLYNVCKIFIGTTNNDRGGVAWMKNFKDFHREHFPSYASYEHFYRDFHRHINPYAINNSTWKTTERKTIKYALVYGYRIQLFWSLDSSEVMIKITRDRKDQFVGDNNFHNRKLGLAPLSGIIKD